MCKHDLRFLITIILGDNSLNKTLSPKRTRYQKSVLSMILIFKADVMSGATRTMMKMAEIV